MSLNAISLSLPTRGLNPHPERVQDKLFLENEFFNPLDLLQVRYEMIRRHQIDKATVTETSKRFGVSRVTFYQIAGMCDCQGLIGLVPQKPGPKSPHKCTEEIIEFVKQQRSQEPDGELHTPGYGVFMLRGMLGWIKALPNLAPTSDYPLH